MKTPRVLTRDICASESLFIRGDSPTSALYYLFNTVLMPARYSGLHRLNVSSFTIATEYHRGRRFFYGLTSHEHGFAPNLMQLNMTCKETPEDKILPLRLCYKYSDKVAEGYGSAISEETLDIAWCEFLEMLNKADYNRKGGNVISEAVLYFEADYGGVWWASWNADDNKWDTNLPIKRHVDTPTPPSDEDMSLFEMGAAFRQKVRQIEYSNH